MTIIARTSTFSLHQRTVSDFNKVFSDLTTLQRQISSGYKTQSFQGLAGQVEQFTDLESHVAKLQNYGNNLTETISRFESVGISLDRIIEVADDMENLITLRRNGAMADNIEFEIQMEGFKKTLARELNTSFAGRYLFGGTRSNIPPVIDEPIPNPVTPGIPDDAYYQGSKENITVRPQDNFEMEFEVRADNAAFQKVFSAVAQSIKGHAEGDDQAISDSLTLLQNGIREVIALNAQNDAKVVNLKDIAESHESFSTYLKGVSEEIIKTDVVTASTQVAIDQTILSATFQSFSRLTSLRLVDFL